MDIGSEASWIFDVSGFVHLPAVLSAKEVKNLGAAVGHDFSEPAVAAAASRPLRGHDALLQTIPELARGGSPYRLDHPVRVLPPAALQGDSWLNSDSVEDARRLGYDMSTAFSNGGSATVRGASHLTLDSHVVRTSPRICPDYWLASCRIPRAVGAGRHGRARCRPCLAQELSPAPDPECRSRDGLARPAAAEGR